MRNKYISKLILRLATFGTLFLASFTITLYLSGWKVMNPFTQNTTSANTGTYKWNHEQSILQIEVPLYIEINFKKTLQTETDRYVFIDKRSGSEVLNLEAYYYMSDATIAEDLGQADGVYLSSKETEYLGDIMGKKVFKINGQSEYQTLFAEQLLFETNDGLLDTTGQIGNLYLSGRTENMGAAELLKEITVSEKV